MPSKKKQVSKKSENGRTHRAPFAVVGRVLLWSAGIALFLLVSYLGYLDDIVRRQFEGKRWALPARIFAYPREIYADYPADARRFEKILDELSYRKDANLSTEATFYREGEGIRLRTRSSYFWDKFESARRLRLDFAGGRVHRIVDIDSGQAQALLRLDPLQIGSFYPTRHEDRVLVRLDEVPKPLVQALLVSEDRRFYEHFGISPRGIARAIWANVRAGRVVQGGSTITQQLAKNLFLTSDRSIWRKINEALMALILEFHYGKEEILEAYLNEIFLGQDGTRAIHGFGLASEFFFNRRLDELQLHHIALLVALAPGPSYYDPKRAPERAKQRRNLVLSAMEEEGVIDSGQAEQARRQPLDTARSPARPSARYPAFLDLVRRQLRYEYREEDLTSEGLRVFTTLDTDVQQALEREVVKTLDQLERGGRASRLETAVVVTRRDGGDVVALMGGREPGAAGFNRALEALRPIGSLVKPVVYLTALEQPGRYTMTTYLDDRGIRLRTQKGAIWAPKNYDLKEHGVVPLHTALAKSYNLATGRLGLALGLDRVIATVRALGVSRPLNPYPSLLLGASALTPFEVTQIYQTLAGDGFAVPLRVVQAVVAKDGTPLKRFSLKIRQAADPGAVYITNTILQEAMRTGTGRSVYRLLPQDFSVVGKTGTTNDLRDSWFAGFSGDYLGVVWLGRDDNRPANLTGAGGALQVWGALMKAVSKEPVVLIPPENIEMVSVDPVSGLRAGCSDLVTYPYIRGSAPVATSPCDEPSRADPGSWFRRWFSDD